MKNINFSTRLFADPSFIEGFGRVIDLGATLQEYNHSQTENEADSKAINNDWRAIGSDLSFSINTYEQELSTAQ